MKHGSKTAARVGAMAFVLAMPGVLWANQDAVETGRLLAILLDAGRVVVGANQALINEKEKGDKGFTADVFESQVIAKFKERAGVDLTNLPAAKVPERAKALLADLLDAEKQTVHISQPLINKQGLGFKNFIPATFGTQAATKFSGKTGIYLKQTTTDPLLRNQKNKADEFEAEILKQFADPAYPRKGEKTVSTIVDGGKSVRLLLPLFYGEKCLVCHGEPRGALDMSAYRKEGGKVGDLGGKLPAR
jgi:general secretion pathway protein A